MCRFEEHHLNSLILHLSVKRKTSSKYFLQPIKNLSHYELVFYISIGLFFHIWFLELQNEFFYSLYYNNKKQPNIVDVFVKYLSSNLNSLLMSKTKPPFPHLTEILLLITLSIIYITIITDSVILNLRNHLKFISHF